MLSSAPQADAPPSAGTSVTEGKATVYFPSEKGVFYNPPQIPNRDLSVLALRQFAQHWQKEAQEKAALQKARADARKHKDAASDKAAMAPSAAAEAGSGTAAPAEETGPPRIRVLDALTASGLRALRYVKEIDEVSSVVANDLDPTAVEALRENVRRNGISEDVIVPSTGNAVDVMMRSKPPDAQRFEAVELDPYGTAAPFLDGAMQCVAEGGLLMVTCTDLAVLCATYPEKCHANYGAYPLKAKYCHEAALRIVLACMEGHANRHKRCVCVLTRARDVPPVALYPPPPPPPRLSSSRRCRA
jgi:tRNA (guanine26-N2/guanine27-N2)-dimethyltransferase